MTSFPTSAPLAVPHVPIAIAARPPRALDTASIGFPLPFDVTSVNFSYIHLQTDDGRRSHIVSASLSRPLFGNAIASVSAFADMADRKSFGVFAGISIPLGGSVTGYGGVSSGRSGTNYNVEASRPMSSEPGSYGWRVRDSEGNNAYRLASGSYRSSVGQIGGEVRQDPTGVGGFVQAQGAVAVMGGGIFPSNRIDDSFAVVDVGLPDVDVLSENRPVGKANADGKILIPNLRSYQKNSITIDPRSLPVDADAPTTHDVVAPRDRSGVVVRMGVKNASDQAVVVLTDKGGKFIAAGASGRLDDSDQTFVIGYDGRTYLKGLHDQNTVVVDLDGGECRASFAFAPKKDKQVVIGPVVCQ